MNSSLDMTLDDLIRSNKQPARGGGGGGRGGAAAAARGRDRGWRGAFEWGSRGPLGVRRSPIGASNRPSSYQLAKTFSRTSDATWQHDLFEDSLGPSGRTLRIETCTKLYVSNLDFGVSNEDIKELFSEIGDLRRCAIHYDRSGQSKGTAEVLFLRRQDAIDAMMRYNDVQLDGKAMKIELIGTNLMFPYSQTANGAGTTVGRGRRTGFMIRGRGRGLGLRRFRGRGRARGWGRGRGRTSTAEELDKELEKYHAETMQTL